MPEEREIFAGQKVLVIGGPDAHAMSMAVLSCQYLESKGATVDIYIGSPVIRQGEGATHSGALFTKTLPKLNVTGIDRVVIVDIPLNTQDMEGSKQRLIELAERINTERHSKNLAPLVHPVIYVDHHSTTKLEVENKQLPGVLVKQVGTAQECRLGSEASIIARIGAICDREESVLPVNFEEMQLAKGFDAAVRPAQDDPKPAEPEVIDDEYLKLLRAWEDRAQNRLNNAVRQLRMGNLDYFKQETEKLVPPQIPVASGFGNVIIVDTQGLTRSFTIYKLMEAAVGNVGIDKSSYAIAVIRNLKDEKLGREPADVVTVIRHWTRTDLKTVDEIIGAELSEKYHAYGAPNARSMRLPVDEQNTSRIVVELLKKFSGVELPDFSQIRSVVMCGDPNSGKSVFSTIFREALKNFGVRVKHLDLDKAAPTPDWYLIAEQNAKHAEQLYSQGKIAEEKLEEAKTALREAAAKRKALKRPWTVELAREARDELMAAAADPNNDFVIGDIGGGLISKDEQGKITNIQRLTEVNATILSGTDSVMVVSNNQAGAAEWVNLVTEGVDPKTGIKIEREYPPAILGVYQSVLEGLVQHVAESRKEAGVITNLDRSLTDRIYNPSIVATALMVSEGVEKRKNNSDEIEESAWAQSVIDALSAHSRTLKGISDTTSSSEKPKLEVDEGEELKRKTAENVRNAIKYLWENRQRKFSSGPEMREFVDQLASIISDGLLKSGQSLYRTWDTKFAHQIPASEVESEYQKFNQWLFEEIDQVDPVELASLIEYRLDGKIHPFADGCGRTTKLLSAFALLKSNKFPPHYAPREIYYEMIRQTEDEWMEFYKQMHKRSY